VVRQWLNCTAPGVCALQLHTLSGKCQEKNSIYCASAAAAAADETANRRIGYLGDC